MHDGDGWALRDARPAALASDRPADTAFADDTRDALADVAFENVPPGHKREVARPLDERMAAACHLHRAYQPALDLIARFGFRERQPALFRQPGPDA